MEGVRKHVLKTSLHRGARLYSCDHCDGFSTDSLPAFRQHASSDHSLVFKSAYDASKYVEDYFKADT